MKEDTSYKPIKPCHYSCQKCGSQEVTRNFAEKGKTIEEYHYFNRQNRDNEFVKTENGNYYSLVKAYVKKDCIFHRCETCGFRFETDVLN